MVYIEEDVLENHGKHVKVFVLCYGPLRRFCDAFPRVQCQHVS